jgi:hypothetical protein
VLQLFLVATSEDPIKPILVTVTYDDMHMKKIIAGRDHSLAGHYIIFASVVLNCNYR